MQRATTWPPNRRSSNIRMPSKAQIEDLQQQQPVYQQPAPPPPQAAAPAPSGATTDDKLAQLKQLGELRESGVLTDAEFEATKLKILGSF
jgi:hypothetical protein